MRWLLISGQWKRNQSFESLIIVQRVEHGESLFQNLIRISSGTNEVEDLSGDILRKASHLVVKLSLGYRDVLDSKLRICLSKPNFSCFWLEHGKLKSDVRSYN